MHKGAFSFILNIDAVIHLRVRRRRRPFHVMVMLAVGGSELRVCPLEIFYDGYMGGQVKVLSINIYVEKAFFRTYKFFGKSVSHLKFGRSSQA